MLPVPFDKGVYTEWKPRQEKKRRLQIELVGSDSDTNTTYSDESEISHYTPSTGSEESLQRHIRQLLPGTPDSDDGGPPKAAKLFDDDDDNKLPPVPPGPLQRVWNAIVDWRSRERERRMHYITKYYEQRVVEYEAKLAKIMKEEIKANEKAIMIEAYRDVQRKVRNSKKKADKKVHILKFTESLNKRDQENEKMSFLCVNLQRWAAETDPIAKSSAEQAERDRLAELKRKEERRQEKLRKKAEKKIADDGIVSLDVAMSQEVLQIMRKGGYKEGILVDTSMDDMSDDLNRIKTMNRQLNENSKTAKSNINKKDQLHLKKSSKSSKGGSMADDKTTMIMDESIELYLRDDIDWAERQKRRKKIYDNPFDVDLSLAKRLRRLRCHLFGQFGAMNLGVEFIRGNCAILEILDMKACEITDRGLGRLLHGVNIGNLVTIEQLLLRGNNLTAKALYFIKDAFDKNLFENLKIIDLRDNELGDDACDTLIRMIVCGNLARVSHLFLQRNGITDYGFSKLMRCLQSMLHTKCPMLQRIALENNAISKKEKRKYWPLPTPVSV